MRILVIEDDEFTAKTLKTILSKQNYAVEIATDSRAGEELIEAFDYDLILMDVMLPRMNGITLCRKLRSRGHKMPILLLTSRDSSHDKAIGLDAGADDYVVKPFDPEELVARIRALLRRGGALVMPVLEYGNLRLDPSTCETTYGTQALQLTPKEHSLLELFLRNRHRVFSCSAILEHVWSYEKTPGEEAVRTQIKGLRHKLKAVGASPDTIETVYGIGYRLKPLERVEWSSEMGKSDRTVNRERDELSPIAIRQQTQAAVAGIWERFKGRVSAQVDAIEKATASLLQNALDEKLRYEAEHESHTLAGSLATFGFSKGSRLARRIERILHDRESLEPGKATHLGKLAIALRQEIDRDSRSSNSSPNNDNSPLLLIVDGDRHLAGQIANESSIWGIRVEIAADLDTARHKIAQNRPDIVLLDPIVSVSTGDSLTLLSELSHQSPSLPVLVFTARDDLNNRLKVARLGGRTFLHKPTPPTQVLDAVTRVLQQQDMPTARVLVVDDDVKILAILRALLEPWGLNIVTLADPQQFWETLEACQPDLLILDVEMPCLSGINLCQIVRNDSRWGGLPVIFLTAHADANIVNAVFAAGADDFVSKPIVGPELISRIISRIDRIKLFKNLAETDSLTKVSNRQKFNQVLEGYLLLAKQNNRPACLAILYLDRLRQINDRYGHATGDTILCYLGQLLRRSFQSEAIVGRWAGAEFTIGIYDTNKEESKQRLDRILTVLQQEEFTASDRSKIKVTFSAGVAQFGEDGTDIQSLYRSADVALAKARLSGGDSIFSAEFT